MDFLPVMVYLPLFGINRQTGQGDYGFFLHVYFLKVGIAFENRHDLIEGCGFFLLKFDYQYSSDTITTFLSSGSCSCVRIKQEDRLPCITHPLSVSLCSYFTVTAIFFDTPLLAMT